MSNTNTFSCCRFCFSTSKISQCVTCKDPCCDNCLILKDPDHQDKDTLSLSDSDDEIEYYLPSTTTTATNSPQYPSRLVRQCKRCNTLDLKLFCLECGSETYQQFMLRCQNKQCRHAVHQFCLHKHSNDHTNPTFWMCPICRHSSLRFKVDPLPASPFLKKRPEVLHITNNIHLFLQQHKSCVDQSEVLELVTNPEDIREQRLLLQKSYRKPKLTTTTINNITFQKKDDITFQTHQDNENCCCLKESLKQTLLEDKNHSPSVHNDSILQKSNQTTAVADDQLRHMEIIKRDNNNENFLYDLQRMKFNDLKALAEVREFERKTEIYKQPSQRQHTKKGTLCKQRYLKSTTMSSTERPLKLPYEELASSDKDPDNDSQTSSFISYSQSFCNTTNHMSCCLLHHTISNEFLIPPSINDALHQIHWGKLFGTLWPLIDAVYRSCPDKDKHPYINFPAEYKSILAAPVKTLSCGSRWFQLYKKATRLPSIQNLPAYIKEILYLLDRLAELIHNEQIPNFSCIHLWDDLLRIDHQYTLWNPSTKYDSIGTLGASLFHVRRMLEQLESVLHYRQYVYTSTSLYDSSLEPCADDPGTATVDCISDVWSLVTLRIHCVFSQFCFHTPLEICESVKAGVFLKASWPIPNRTIISEYCGKIEPQRFNLTKLSNHSNSIFDLWNTGISDTSLCINPEPYTNIGRFFSHGINYKAVNVRTCTLNIDQKVRIFLITKRKIDTGEILYINYNAGNTNEYPTEDFSDNITDNNL